MSRRTTTVKSLSRTSSRTCTPRIRSAKPQGAPKTDLAQDAAASRTLRFGVLGGEPPHASVAWQYEQVAAASGTGAPHDGQVNADGLDSFTGLPSAEMTRHERREASRDLAPGRKEKHTTPHAKAQELATGSIFDALSRVGARRPRPRDHGARGRDGVTYDAILDAPSLAAEYGPWASRGHSSCRSGLRCSRSSGEPHRLVS